MELVGFDLGPVHDGPKTEAVESPGIGWQLVPRGPVGPLRRSEDAPGLVGNCGRAMLPGGDHRLARHGRAGQRSRPDGEP